MIIIYYSLREWFLITSGTSGTFGVAPAWLGMDFLLAMSHMGLAVSRINGDLSIITAAQDILQAASTAKKSSNHHLMLKGFEVLALKKGFQTLLVCIQDRNQ